MKIQTYILNSTLAKISSSISTLTACNVDFVGGRLLIARLALPRGLLLLQPLHEAPLLLHRLSQSLQELLVPLPLARSPSCGTPPHAHTLINRRCLRAGRSGLRMRCTCPGFLSRRGRHLSLSATHLVVALVWASGQ